MAAIVNAHAGQTGSLEQAEPPPSDAHVLRLRRRVWEDEAGRLDANFFQNRKGAVVQRHRSNALGLGVLRRDLPDPAGQVKLFPGGGRCFAKAGTARLTFRTSLRAFRRNFPDGCQGHRLLGASASINRSVSAFQARSSFFTFR